MQLLRDFIHQSLYDPEKGYFCKDRGPVGYLDGLQFRDIVSRDEYYMRVKSQYQRLGKYWLTPSEIFSPHVGIALAKFMMLEISERKKMARVDERCPLRIFEIGAGNGMSCQLYFVSC